MKKLIILLMSCTMLGAVAQPEDEEITYYTDSRVKNSRFSIALNANPYFTDVRLINDELATGGGFDLLSDEATGTFQFNYNLDVFFEVGSSFDVGIGFGRASGGFTLKDVAYYQGHSDTIMVDDEVAVEMYTIPLKINFNTAISDVFDLEVLPTVELNIIDKYTNTFIPDDSSLEKVKFDYTNRTRNINFSVGIDLGGTYYFADQWGVFVRGSVKYLLNAMVEEDNFPRETLLNFGGNVGIKYSF